MASSAQANDRELYLYYTHTKETIRIVYKSNGRFVQSALDRLNVFLRDWRRNEPAEMDPALFDVLWEVYQRTGASEPIHIVSAYRSPATNAMLASNSSGVADNSQHMRGKAIDFFIPGIPVSRIRELGFLMQVGGVGYYPNSGSPFVHLDTGSVRAWPRMTTAQLQQLFPDGRTMHISTNGQTLPGYQVAKAEWERCRRVPCNASVPDGGTRVASGDRPRTLWDLFTGGDDQAPASAPSAPVQVASAPAPQAPVAPQATAVATPPAAGPVQQASSSQPPAPPIRPADLSAGTMVADAPVEPQDLPFQVVDAQDMIAQVAMASETDNAPMPPSISRTLAEMRASTPSAYASTGGRLEVAATEPTAPTPVARPDFAPVITASLAPQPISAADPLEMRPSIDPDALVASQPHEPSELDAFASLFDGAVLPAAETPPATDAAMTNAVASLSVAEGQLFTPGLDTVTDTLTAPTALSDDQFAFGAADAGTGDDSAPVLASGFTRTAALGHSSNTFGPAQTIWVHYDSASN